MNFLFLNTSSHTLQSCISDEDGEGAERRERPGMLRPEQDWAVLQGWWHYSLAAGKQTRKTSGRVAKRLENQTDHLLSLTGA